MIKNISTDYLFGFDPYCQLRTIWPAIIAGIGALGTAAIGAASNSGARKINIANRIADHQSKLNWDAFLRESEYNNRYNSPKQQMQRLAEAGLNPNLVYGSGASAGTAGASLEPARLDNNPENYRSNAMDYVNGVVNAVNAYYNVRSQQQSIRNAEAAEALTRAKENSQVLRNSLEEKTAAYKVETLAAKTMQEQFKANVQQVVDYENSVAKLNKQIQELQNLKTKDDKAREEIENLKVLRGQMETQIDLLNAQIKKTQEETAWMIDTKDIRKVGLSLDNLNKSAAYRNALTGGDLLQERILTERINRVGKRIDNMIAGKKLQYYDSDRDYDRKFKEASLFKKNNKDIPFNRFRAKMMMR